MKGDLVRTEYIDKLSESKGENGTVKVLTGMRRCGKTSVLEQYVSYLRDAGVPDSDIIYLDFDKRSGQEYSDSVRLDAYFAGRLSKERQTHVLLNNICHVRDWNQSVLKLLSFGNCDLYLCEPTVGPIVDAISEFRSDVKVKEVKVYPLSFKEYVAKYPTDDVDALFRDYAVLGGMPDVDPSMGERRCDDQLEGILNTIVLHDLVLKAKDDPRTVLDVAKYVYTHIGELVSVADIAKACRISSGSAERILSDLESAYLVCRADRYDVNMGRIKEHPFVLYATDNGLRDFALRYDTEISFKVAMENIVYLELKRRGYRVRAGSVHESGVSFTALKGNDPEYYIIAPSVDVAESCGVKDIIDNGNKIMLTMDRNVPAGCGNAKLINICDWLLG